MVKNPNRNEIIWFCSKILTIQKMIEKNMESIYPIKDIDSNNEKTLIVKNYSYLL
jgi:hypothetical protein